MEKIIKRLKKPELVAPAGDWPSLVTAVENGADSVYFGVKGFTMRQMADNFDMFELKKIMELLHAHKKKGYLALNVIIMENELKKIETILRQAKTAKVDAVILWDMSVLTLAKKLGLRMHISTQASISNTKALDFFAQQGVQRIILARECNLENIKQIVRYRNKKKICTQIEAFIHGAMCVSISGRCFLSSYTSGKSANRGQCRQYCRREFSIVDQQKEADYVLGNDYILSAKDLCTIDFTDRLINAGIDSFKIEGRRRSPEYLKVVTSVYRSAIDAFFDQKLSLKLKEEFKEKLSAVFNRGFSNGFYFGYPEDAKSTGLENKYEKVFLGEVVKFYKKISVAEIFLRNNPLHTKEELLFIGTKTPACITAVDQLQQNHKFVKGAKKGEAVGVKVPFTVRPKDKVFLWKKKEQ